MKDFDIPVRGFRLKLRDIFLRSQREAIVARPIKFSSLYNAVLPSEDGEERDTRKPIGKGAKKSLDKHLSKVSIHHLY
jgi:hypothetical protein